MFFKIARFELRHQFKQPLVYSTFAIFFLFAFGAAATDDIQIGVGGAVHDNAPVAIAFTTLILAIFAVFLSAAFAGHSVVRDAASKTEGYMYACPVTGPELLIGRFVGSFIMTMIAFSGVSVGLALGSLMPWLDPETLGPFRAGDYLYTLVTLAAPSLFATSAAFFMLATLTRSIMAAWVGLVAFLVIYFTGLALLTNDDLVNTVAIIDPFGGVAMGRAVRDWTVFEQNTQLPPFEGLLMWNRLLWMGLGVVFVGITAALFNLRGEAKRGAKPAKIAKDDAPAVAPADFSTTRAAPTFSPAMTPLRQFLARMAVESRAMTRSVAFWVILALGAANTLAALLTRNITYGTPIYPVTRVMVETAGAAFGIVPLIIGVFFAAETSWRERQVKIHEVIDATPAPSWALIFPKMATVILMVFALMTSAVVTGVIVQIAKGYADVEFGLYLQRLIIFSGFPFALIAILSFFVQAVTGNKWAGLGFFLVYIGIDLALSQMGLNHPLYNFASRPETPLSDLNGVGHFEAAARWFDLYWGAIAGLMTLLAFLLWPRGGSEKALIRLKAIPSRLGPVTGALAGVFLLTAGGAGGYIFYNVNVLNEYRTPDEQEAFIANYEKKYFALADVPQPKITDVRVEVDLYPEELRYDVRGVQRIENKTDGPIDVVHVELAGDVAALTLDGEAYDTVDDDYDHYVFELARPMAPGEGRDIAFETTVAREGFSQAGGNGSAVVENGTFINNFAATPLIGHNPNRRLLDPSDRRKYGLEPTLRAAKLEDESHWDDGFLRGDSDWVTFEAVVSTAPDQIAIAPGYLQREWTENGRRHFHYEMDAPIQNFWSVLSARYAIAKDKWNDVSLEVYHHDDHAMNVDGMMEAMKRSFDYFSENFSPYQYRQMRVIEFPAYASFAQSFPNTVPYSESIGFIADVRDPEDVDYVFYVTSHEMAHQWWGHQLSAADVQGAAMLSETLSQYSALMVMKAAYGDAQVRKFLEFERNAYLRSRGAELLEELPLHRVENQGYIHYRKGSNVMYALQDYVGEDVVNRALARLLDEYALESSPYPRSVDFLRILREEAGPEHDGLITDLFEKITLYDLELTETEVVENADGAYEVALTIEATKLYADGEGEETEAPLDLMIDVGVFSEDPDDAAFGDDPAIYVAKHRVTSGENVIRFTVDEKPSFAAVDPYAKLLDRDPEDNGDDVSITQRDSASLDPKELTRRVPGVFDTPRY